MDVAATYTFDAPRDQVWSLLIDPAIIATCLPGCESMQPTGDDTYKATLTIGIAAITGRYEGVIQMTDKREPGGYTLVVEGQGKPGFVKGSATISLTEVDTRKTAVEVTGTAKVGGTIARVGQRLLGSVSKMMMDRFFACLQDRVKSSSEVSQ